MDGGENLTTGSGKFKPLLFIPLTNVIQLVACDKTMLNFIRHEWYTMLVFCTMNSNNNKALILQVYCFS